MSLDVKVPDIGDFKDVGVIEVLVKPGDSVKVEQSLITIESDKASMEIPSSHAGVVKEIKVKVGDTVNQGSVILSLDEAAAGASPAPAPSAAPSAAAAAAPAAAPCPAAMRSSLARWSSAISARMVARPLTLSTWPCSSPSSLAAPRSFAAAHSSLSVAMRSCHSPSPT